MSKVVLDASAVLAILNGEPGANRLSPELLGEAVISMVNLAEVQSKLIASGVDPDEAWESAVSPVREAVAFTAEHAKLTGSLASKTRSLGLSLGDRACLALGLLLDAPVYTADKSWTNAKVGVRVQVIR